MSKKELIELLEKLLGTLPAMVLLQIDKFVKAGLSHKDIARAVYYLFDVQHRDKTTIAKYGIGLVPHVVVEANGYYERIKRQYEEQRKQLENVREIDTLEVEPMERKKKERGIDIDGL